jgi:CMP-N-acetylneuraminic acid synthetase
MILGLVAAKDNSNRFPEKNKHIHDGKPLFWHSVKPLLDSKVDDVYVITDSDYIKSYCEERNVGVIWRPKNATRDEDKLVSILRFGYYSLDVDYDIVVSLMANCPGHSTKIIDDGIDLLQDKKMREVRSFNNDGEESGLLIFSKEILQNNFDISYYIGGLTSDVKEIHYKEDLI